MSFFTQKHLWIIPAYAVLYLAGFWFIEQQNSVPYILDSPLDAYIPFCEYFVVFYISWFFFIAATVYYFSYKNRDVNEFYACMMSIAFGMTLFIIVSLVFPNGHTLRPELHGENIFIIMVQFLYFIDTPTNIMPSMHVYVAVVCGVAFLKNERVKQCKVLWIFILILTIGIVASTIFIKQHTIVDVFAALALNAVSSAFFYKVFPVHKAFKD